MNRASAVLLLLLLLSPHARATQATPSASDARLEAIDRAIRTAMKAWDVAGTSVAIVKDGKLVYLEGHGVRDARERTPVDGDTIFAIGSMTKSVTAVLAGLAVDEKKLTLDDLLTQRVPNFSVADPYVTGAATIRDALSHRTGFDWTSDGLLLNSHSRRELIDQLARLRPPHRFRYEYNYANVIYIVGSEAVAGAWSDSWENVVREKVFEPLGMTRSSATLVDAQKLGNMAMPHRNSGNGPQLISAREINIAGGAGAINASAKDMARFVMMMAEGGKLGSTPFLQPQTYDEILEPHSNIGVEPYLRPVTNFHSYGLGWELLDYKGKKVALHGGAIDGMLSEMAVVPGERLGIVVLTNTDGARYLPEAITFTILDHFLGGERIDWTAPLLARGNAIRQMLHGTPARTTDTSLSLPLAAYAGRYAGPLGSIDVARDRDGLTFAYGVLKGRLEHWHHDTFRGSFGTYGQRLVTFSIGKEHVPDRMNVEFIGEFDRVH